MQADFITTNAKKYNIKNMKSLPIWIDPLHDLTTDPEFIKLSDAFFTNRDYTIHHRFNGRHFIITRGKFSGKLVSEITHKIFKYITYLTIQYDDDQAYLMLYYFQRLLKLELKSRELTKHDEKNEFYQQEMINLLLLFPKSKHYFRTFKILELEMTHNIQSRQNFVD